MIKYLIRYIRDNKSSTPSVVFNNAKEKVISIDYITGIMLTYHSKDFADMNKIAVTISRKEGGVNIKALPSLYKQG